MLLSSLTVGITWKHWELMSSMQLSQGKKVDHAPASTPPRPVDPTMEAEVTMQALKVQERVD